MEFAQRFKQAMENKSITAYRLAKELGVHQTTIKNWVDGKGEPHLNQLKQIAKILNADIVYLISGQSAVEIENGILIQVEAEARAELEQIQMETRDKSYEERVLLNSTILQMLKLLRGFNATGCQKALERVEELAEISRYCCRSIFTTPGEMPMDVPGRQHKKTAPGNTESGKKGDSKS